MVRAGCEHPLIVLEVPAPHDGDDGGFRRCERLADRFDDLGDDVGLDGENHDVAIAHDLGGAGCSLCPQCLRGGGETRGVDVERADAGGVHSPVAHHAGGDALRHCTETDEADGRGFPGDRRRCILLHCHDVSFDSFDLPDLLDSNCRVDARPALQPCDAAIAAMLRMPHSASDSREVAAVHCLIIKVAEHLGSVHTVMLELIGDPRMRRADVLKGGAR